MTPEQKANCKAACCQSPFGQLLTNALGPMSTVTGGLIQSPCAANAIAKGLEKPAESAEGAAARIKQDEAGAQARREAMRYLGTVDCNYWPEAKKALCDGLLFDRNECVRLEAALALQRGCCCCKEVVKALTDCVTGKSEPVERSERVKSAAMVALSRCVIADEPAPKELERKDDVKKVEFTTPAEYYKQVQQINRADVMEQARKALAQVHGGEIAVGTVTTAMPSRPTSVFQIVSNAISPGSAARSGEVVQTGPGGAVQSGAGVTTASTSERRPFFDNLTRALKGKQTGSLVQVPQETPAVLAAPVTPAVPVSPILPPQAKAQEQKTPRYNIVVFSVDPPAPSLPAATETPVPSAPVNLPLAAPPAPALPTKTGLLLPTEQMQGTVLPVAFMSMAPPPALPPAPPSALPELPKIPTGSQQP